MIVLIVHNAGNSKFPSGEETVVNNEFLSLRSRGIEVYKHVIYNDIALNSFAKRISAGTDVFWSSPSYNQIDKLIEKYKPDIVHFHSVLPLLTVSVFSACHNRGVPVIQTLHNYRWFCIEGGMYRNNTLCKDCLVKGSFSGIIHKCSQNNILTSSLLTLNNKMNVRNNNIQYLVDRFIAVSSFVKEEYISAGFPEDKILIKYNGINIPSNEEIKYEERDSLVFVGRLVKAKGVETLMYLIQHIQDVPIKIVGDGPELMPLKQFCMDKKNRNVELLGKKNRADVGRIMSKARCVVVPSLFPETFGLAAAEAMSYGTPVVASKIGALTEIVEESEGGILVDPKDTQGFLSAVRYICTSKTNSNDMGIKGREYVKEHFSQNHSTDRLVDIYKNLVIGI
jgi:glycosyltransferase involved in cell wall biosynthesis